jgi:hypothetical protein
VSEEVKEMYPIPPASSPLFFHRTSASISAFPMATSTTKEIKTTRTCKKGED